MVLLAVNQTQHTHSTAQHSTAQHSTAQHSTAQHSTAQHSTAQHSTAQPCKSMRTHTHSHTFPSPPLHTLTRLHRITYFYIVLNMSSSKLHTQIHSQRHT